MSIKLSDHVVSIKGRPYLPVPPRVAFCRQETPTWSIVTDVIIVNDEPRMVRATVCDGDGRVISTGHKTVTDYSGGAVEKAETGAIGRALAFAGIGTLQALELDEGDELADAPAPPPTPARKPTAAAARKVDTTRDIPPTPDEIADIAALGLDELRAAYKATMNAGRVTLAAQIKGMADTLKAKAAA